MMMRRCGLGAMAVALALAAAPVRADVIRVFEANGVFTDGVKLGGALTIDVTEGDVTAANLLLSGPISAEVTVLAATGKAGGSLFQTFLSPPGGSFPTIVLGFLTPSLVGYGGGPLASLAMSAEGTAGFYFPAADADPVVLASGTLAFPEPSTWAMMLVGFAGLGYAGYRRASEPPHSNRAARKPRRPGDTYAASFALSFWTVPTPTP